MNHPEFDSQIDRLNSQWKNTYGHERRALIWKAFENVPIDDFRAAVDQCLAAHRGAPLLDELSKEVDLAKSRRLSSEPRGGSFYGVINDAARANTAADPDFVKACLAHIRRIGKIPADQYQRGCDEIETIAKQLCPTSRPGSYARSASNNRDQKNITGEKDE